MGKEKSGAGLRLFYKASYCIYKNFRLRIQILYQFLITPSYYPHPTFLS